MIQINYRQAGLLAGTILAFILIAITWAVIATSIGLSPDIGFLIGIFIGITSFVVINEVCTLIFHTYYTWFQEGWNEVQETSKIQ